METPTNTPEALARNEEDEDEEQSGEEGSGSDEECKVPEYELQHQEHLRKNALKLQELGVPLLAAAFCESLSTSTEEVGGGEGNVAGVKTSCRAGANSKGHRQHCFGLG